MSSFALAPALIALLPLTKAHMSLWIDSMYGFDQSYEPVTPMAGLSFDQWWFHGYTNDQPSAVTTLIPGSDLTVEIACQKGYTSYGGNPTSDACPGDSGSYHAGGSTGSGSGWSGNSESNLMGCALAIAFKPTASQTNPEDFTVMSIQENCVRQRQTSFSIPNNLPACPEGGCTCAWFWQGKNSANEMYMTGFRCDVQGGAAGGSYPQPVPPRKGAINGPTQPMYWANTPTNLDYTPDWETKPSYNSAWGWTNGAQTGAFGAATGGSGSGAGSSNSTAGVGTSTKTGKGSTSTSAGGYGSSPSSTAAYGNGNEYDSPSSTAYGAPTSTEAWNDGADGEYAQPTSSSTRGRRPRPTHTQAYGGEDSYGEEGEEKPSWQELAADPIETGTDSSDAGAGEQALVETGSGSPKKCNRHNRRSRLRTRAKKSQV